MFRKIFYLSMIISLGISLFIFNGCDMGGGGGSGGDGDNTTTEEVKWTKVADLGRPSIDDRNKVAISSTLPLNGWAIGGGNFWKLSNGQWVRDVSYGKANLYAIALVDQDNGWAVGYNTNESNDAVWKLENGVWSDVSAGYSDKIFININVDGCSIALTDMNKGWAVGDGGSYDGKIFKLDGGVWHIYVDSLDPAINNYTSVDLVDDSNNNEGWAVGDGKFIKLSSGDWGYTDPVQTFSGEINVIVLDDSSNGFAYGSNIWELSEGSWSGGSGIITNPTQSDNNAYASITYLGIKKTVTSTYSGWAYCDPDTNVPNDEQLRKLNNNEWDNDYNLTPSFSVPVKIINEDNGDAWAICSNGAVWSYDSDNDSWSVALAGGGNELFLNYGIGSDFIGIDNGRLVGYGGTEATGANLRLINGSWECAPNISSIESFDSISLIDLDNGWAGKSYGDKAFAKLENGTWTLNGDITLGYNDKVTAIDLIDIDNGWAAGTVSGQDTFWKLSIDSGNTEATWQQSQQFTTNNRPIYIHLNDMDTGWAVARNGAKWVLSEVYGEATWSKVRDGRPEADGISSDEYVMFYPIDENNGWEMIYNGSYGRIEAWKLVNNNWQEIPQEDLPFDIGALPVCAFSDIDNGWAARNTRIFKLENGKWLLYYADENGNATENTNTEDPIVHIWLQDYQNGWAIGNNMSIYRLSPNE